MAIPPVSPASLDNTMSGMDAQTQADALAQLLQQQLAQQAQAAAGEAQQAQGQYQQAAGAPVPEPNPMDVLIPTLFGNVASVLGRNPEYAQQGQESVKVQRGNLLKARADNLASLQNVFEQKARIAEEAGDLEATEGARLKLEQLRKVHEQILESQKQEGRMSLEAARGENEQKEAEIRRRETAGQAAKAEASEKRRIAQSSASISAAIRADPDIKNFVTVRDQFNMGLKSAQSKSNLGDILLMRAIARASDPLSSVREEEFRTFKGAQGALAQYGINLTRAMWGKGMLSDFGRSQMVGELRKIYNSKKVQYNRAYEQYRTRAAAEGVPEANVLRDYETPEDAPDATAPVNGEPSGKVMVVNPKGKRFEIDASDLPEAIKRGWKRTQ